jgi:hypothetical protein
MADIVIDGHPLPSPMAVFEDFLISRGSLPYRENYIDLCVEEGGDFLRQLDDDTIKIVSEQMLQDLMEVLEQVLNALKKAAG